MLAETDIVTTVEVAGGAGGVLVMARTGTSSGVTTGDKVGAVGMVGLDSVGIVDVVGVGKVLITYWTEA